MKVITAKSAGFCFGVKNAVTTALKMASDNKDGERLIMLGELTHNEKVTEDLLREVKSSSELTALLLSRKDFLPKDRFRSLTAPVLLLKRSTRS